MEPMLVDDIVISVGKACDVWKRDRRIVVRRSRGRLVASQWDCWLLATLASVLSGLLSSFLRGGEIGGGLFSLPDFKARSSERMLLRVVLVSPACVSSLFSMEVLSSRCLVVSSLTLEVSLEVSVSIFELSFLNLSSFLVSNSANRLSELVVCLVIASSTKI